MIMRFAVIDYNIHLLSDLQYYSTSAPLFPPSCREVRVVHLLVLRRVIPTLFICYVVGKRFPVWPVSVD